MLEEKDWEVALEAAWGRFRADLADALAGLEDGQVLSVAWGPELLTDFEDDDEAGAAPYVQAIGWGEDQLRVEAVSNYFLDDRFALPEDAESELVEMGWMAPTYDQDGEDEGSSNFWCDLERREADRAAVLAVRALREVYGCLHPCLLDTRGIAVGQDEPGAATGVPAFEDLPPTWPSSREELSTAVLGTLGAMRGKPVKVDSDGDVPFRVGRSVAYVRVLEDRPVVQIFAVLLLGADDVDRGRLLEELNIMNRARSAVSVCLLDDAVVMSRDLVATPFVPAQLKIEVEAFCHQLDGTARDLVERVGGRRFLDEEEDREEPEPEPEPGPCPGSDPAVDALVEMLHAGRLPNPSVVELFAGDRDRMVAALSQVRQGWPGCDAVEQKRALDALRRALRSMLRAGPAGGSSGHRLSVLEADPGPSRRRA